jgi:hypothetical protein
MAKKKTINPEKPPSKPARLDQFAGDIFGTDGEEEERLGVTSRREKRVYWDKS